MPDIHTNSLPCGCRIDLSFPEPGRFACDWRPCPVHRWAERSAEFCRHVHRGGFDLTDDERAFLDELIKCLDGNA
jgi:hypothetical protein